MDVVAFSRKTKQEADTLLKYGAVLDVLSKYGEVVISGSYKYDLMWGPNIDLVVLSDKPEVASLQAFNDFAKQRNFRKYQLGDFIKFPMEGRPQGFIVVLIHEFEGRKWEIEIWFKESLSDDEKHFEKLLSTASSEQRKSILELKKQREDGGLSKHKIDSATIYKGVINEGKVNLQDF